MILFLAANPRETDRLALDREARAIHVELKRSGRLAMSPGISVIAVGVSLIAGVVFGLYPAVRAARVAPIVALRAE